MPCTWRADCAGVAHYSPDEWAFLTIAGGCLHGQAEDGVYAFVAAGVLRRWDAWRCTAAAGTA